MYYTERTPKNKKQGRPGNEARLGHSFELTVTVYRNGLSFARLQYYGSDLIHLNYECCCNDLVGIRSVLVVL